MVNKKAQMRALSFLLGEKKALGERKETERLDFHKKAQMKIQQMAFMLIAVTIFFVLVAMFVLVIKTSGMKDEANRLKQENALLLATKIANSPEFACGESFGTSRTNCIDEDKVMILKKNIDNYKDFWGVGTNIEIRKIYKWEGKDIPCTQQNYPDCNIINLQDEELSADYSNFVALCRQENSEGEVYPKCELAKIMVGYQNIY